MKLRLQNNTIRIRLNEREVERLDSGDILVNETWFPTAKLTINLSSGNTDMVDYKDNSIKITVNKNNVSSWSASDEVTIAMEFSVSNDKKLSILVEKDMKV